MAILLTGGTGFVGRLVTARLAKHHAVVVPFLSTVHTQHEQPSVTYVNVARLPETDRWGSALNGCETVVHLAGRAHVLRESAADSLAAFRKVNVEGTLSLARLARDNGVKRFVFVSSIGVNGGRTTGSSVTEESVAAPHADYALSKWEAEQGLWDVVRGTDMELVIIRPPLVYAGHAPGNFARLLKLVAAGVPLPLGLVRNQRSMVALENLVDFLVLCIDHPDAANELFVISDGQDVSTPQIIQYLAQGMNKSPRLFPMPPSVLNAGARLLGKGNMYSQLCDSLVVDSSKARRLLGWRPVISTGDGLKKAGHEFLSARAAG